MATGKAGGPMTPATAMAARPLIERGNWSRPEYHSPALRQQQSRRWSGRVRCSSDHDVSSLAGAHLRSSIQGNRFERRLSPKS